MSALDEFEIGLRGLLEEKHGLRPFVCSGSPVACRIFIVGLNAATEMQEDFWEFWDGERGFDREKWLKAYLSRRKGDCSPTRKRIRKIIDGAKPIPILETNLYSTPTPKATDLHASERTTEVFDYLFNTIRPSAVLLHQKPVKQYFETKAGRELKLNTIEEIKVDDVSLLAYATRPLFTCSFDHAFEYGNLLKRAVQGI